MLRQRFLFAALGLLTLWRWALLPTLELAPHEALAVFRANHGQFGGFLEMGPLVPLTAKLGMLFGGTNEFGVRFFAPLLALAASLVVWRLARDLFDRQTAGWAVVILNVLPAFNLASITLTPATLACVLAPLTAMKLHKALGQADPRQKAWWAVAACVAGMVAAQPPALATMAAVVLVLALPKRLRPQLQGTSFRAIMAGWSVMLLCWLIWQGWHGWPAFHSGYWQPEWRLVPNLLRWAVLASPLMLVQFVMFMRVGFIKSLQMPRRGLLWSMLLPLAGIDFFYGTHDSWPDMGGMAWLPFAAMLLAHHGLVANHVAIEQKISLRTIAIVLAALQSAFLLQSDLPRTLGLPWRFSCQSEAETDFTHFFFSDPSKAMRGWRESARLVSAVFKKAGGNGSWFVLTSDWQLAVELDHYLGQAEKVLSASDDLHTLAGQSAIYVTEDREAISPPDGLKNRFERIEVLSVARVMHAGNEVRWLKIFACHHYRPPDS